MSFRHLLFSLTGNNSDLLFLPLATTIPTPPQLTLVAPPSALAVSANVSFERLLSYSRTFICTITFSFKRRISSFAFHHTSSQLSLLVF